ncbi:NADPH-dependent FMN reductase [Aquibacillus albus]|uniref:FMN reductase n=1 Tax=Aquibacillus albus TaxID=1168171 RepID=A0ABS2N3H8_9BACI|nr:FMN reductase [Aquibacillus albus]
MKKIVVISGCPSNSSRLYGVIDQVIEKLEQREMDVDHIEVFNLPADDLIHAKFDSDEIKASNSLVQQADAVVIATPVYKASFSGILKSYLDLLPQKGLENKNIFLIVMGGTIAHLLSIEYALKPVLSVLGATHIEKEVFIQDSQVVWNDHGKVDLSEEVNQRLETSISRFMNNLIMDNERGDKVTALINKA